jgi:signal transduction histidine kinase
VEVRTSDEIGALSEAFNEMAAALEESHQDSEEKERLRVALMERLVNVQEEERKNIARELHDQIGQSLSATLLSIHQNCKYISHSGSLCQEMEQTMYELIDEVHQLAWQMRPPILDDYGLDSALKRHLEKVQAQFRLDIDYQYTSSVDSDRLPGNIELTLYRVAQEAILNVVRHANASRASVVLLRQDHSVSLLVEDDGCGFDPESENGDGGIHLGLIGLRERVGLCNGSLLIESAEGVGTTVRVRVPLS